MTFDAHANLAVSTVVTPPSPATTGTVLTVTAGEGARFPAAPFNATIGPPNLLLTPGNAEIVRVTGITGDTFTVLRRQEGTSAQQVAAGWVIADTITVKALTDIEAAATSNTAAVTAETSRATTAEATLSAAVTAETARAEAAEALLAPLASPALTGTPTVPTASPGTNTTQAASTAFVTAAVSAINGGTP